MRRILLVLLAILPISALALDRVSVSERVAAVGRTHVERVPELEAELDGGDDVPTFALAAGNDLNFVFASASAVTTTSEEVPAFVPGMPEDDISQFVGLLPQLVSAVKSGRWDLVIAISLMLAVFVVRRFFLKQVPPGSTKWVVLGLALVFNVATGLVGGVPIAEALIQGVTTALMTVGAWEFGGKTVLKKALPGNT